MRRALTSISVAVCLAGATAAAQPAAASNVSATHAYIQANYALAKAAVARIGPVQAKIQALNASLAQQCPRVGKGALEIELTQPVSHEVVAAMWSIAYGTNAGSIASFAAKAKHLRWSNGRITRLVSRYAKDLQDLATFPLPNVCEDVRAFAASGFSTVPARTIALVTRVESIEPEPVPPRLLAPYERGSDASVLAKTLTLETKLEEQEFNLGQTDWLELLETLALPQ
jgi:hypothetical protein